MKINKWLFEYVIVGLSSYGKEDIDSFETIQECKKMLIEYRLAMPEFSLKIIKRRILNDKFIKVV